MRVSKTSRFDISVIGQIFLLTLFIQTIKANEPNGFYQVPEEHASINDINLSLEKNVPQTDYSIRNSEETDVADQSNFWNAQPLDGQIAEENDFNAQLLGDDRTRNKLEATERSIINSEYQPPATDRYDKYGILETLGKVLEKRPIIPILVSKSKIIPHGGWGRKPRRRPRRKPKWRRRPRRYRKRRPRKRRPGHKRRRPRRKPRHKRRNRYRHRRPHFHDEDPHPHFPDHHDFDNPSFSPSHAHHANHDDGFRESNPVNHNNIHDSGDHFDGPNEGFSNNPGKPEPESHYLENDGDNGFHSDYELEHSNNNDGGGPSKGFFSSLWARIKPYGNNLEQNHGHEDSPGDSQSRPPSGPFKNPFGQRKPTFGPPDHGPDDHPGNSQSGPPSELFKNPFGPSRPNFGQPDHGPEGNNGNFHSEPRPNGPPRKPFRRPKPYFGPTGNDGAGYEHGPESHPGDTQSERPFGPFHKPFGHRKPNLEHHDGHEDHPGNSHSGPPSGPFQKPFGHGRPNFDHPDHGHDDHPGDFHSGPPSGQLQKPFGHKRPNFDHPDHGLEDHPGDSHSGPPSGQLRKPFGHKRPNFDHPDHGLEDHPGDSQSGPPSGPFKKPFGPKRPNFGPPHHNRPDFGHGPEGNNENSHSEPRPNGPPRNPFRRPKPQFGLPGNYGTGFEHVSEGHPDDSPSGPPVEASQKPFGHRIPNFGPPGHNDPGFGHGPEVHPTESLSGPFKKPFGPSRPNFGPPDHGPEGNNGNFHSEPHPNGPLLKPFRRPKPYFGPPANDGPAFDHGPEGHPGDSPSGPRRQPFGRPNFGFGPAEHGPGFPHESQNNHDHFPNDFKEESNSGPSLDDGPPKHSDGFDFNNGPEHQPDSIPNSINEQLNPINGPPRRPFRIQRPINGPPEINFHGPTQNTESSGHYSGNFQPPRRPHYYNKPYGPRTHGENELNTNRPHSHGQHFNNLERPNDEYKIPRRPRLHRPKPGYPSPPHDNPNFDNNLGPNPMNNNNNLNNPSGYHGPPTRPYSFRPPHDGPPRPRPIRPPPSPNHYDEIPRPIRPPPLTFNQQSPRVPLVRPHRPLFVPPKEPEVIYGKPMKEPQRPPYNGYPYSNPPQSPHHTSSLSSFDHPGTAYGNPQSGHRLRLPIPFNPLPPQNRPNGNNPHHNNFVDQFNKPLGSPSQSQPQRPGVSQALFNQVKHLVYKLSLARNNTNSSPMSNHIQHHFRPSNPFNHGNSIQSSQHQQPIRIPFKLYSTLPQTVDQFKPDPTHQTLPKLTYDSINSGSTQQQHNRHPEKVIKNNPSKSAVKFTAADAIAKMGLQKRSGSAEKEVSGLTSKEIEVDLKPMPEKGSKEDLINIEDTFF